MKKDLSPLAKDIEKVMKKHFPGRTKRISVGVAFALPDDYEMVYFVTNVPRPAGISLFQATADKMRSQVQ